MSQPRITVVIPNLNQGLYLEQAICSVLDQGYENLELIVMDGGSTDESLDIIRACEEDLDHWQSTWDSGPAEAINTALTWASGELFLVLDADDTLLPYALHEAAVAFADTDVSWAVGSAIRVDEDDDHLADLPADPPRGLAGCLLREGEPMPGSATLYRTDLLKAMGGFESTLKLAYTHEMHARLFAAKQKPAVIRAAFAAIRDHDDMLSTTHSLACGPEFMEVADRYAQSVSPTQRYLLWRSNDERRRIYEAARLEMQGNDRLRERWTQLLKRPWWLTGDDYRRNLLQSLVKAGVPHTLDTPEEKRRAA